MKLNVNWTRVTKMYVMFNNRLSQIDHKIIDHKISNHKGNIMCLKK